MSAASRQIYSGGVGSKCRSGRSTDRLTSKIARGAGRRPTGRRSDVDLETTNIKLVARWREIDDQGANVTESRSGAVQFVFLLVLEGLTGRLEMSLAESGRVDDSTEGAGSAVVVVVHIVRLRPG